MTQRQPGELLQGTLEMLVLKTLSIEALHGWGISQRIRDLSRGVFDVNQGSLYPALQRMKRKGWIASDWRTTAKNRRARYYELTPAGWAQLETESAQWGEVSRAVNRIMRFTPGEA